MVNISISAAIPLNTNYSSSGGIQYELMVSIFDQMCRNMYEREPQVRHTLSCESMLNFLNLTRGFFTGSGCLRMLLGMVSGTANIGWHNGDLDIFIPRQLTGATSEKTFDETLEEYIQSGFPRVKIHKHSRSCGCVDYCMDGDKFVNREQGCAGIESVWDLSNGIQLILILSDALEQYTTEATPPIVSFCRSTFDLQITANGITSSCFYPSLEGPPLGLAARQTNFAIPEHQVVDVRKLRGRKRKYQERGIVVTNDEAIESFLDNLSSGECAICGESQCDITLRSCQHTFHAKCLLEWSFFKCGDFVDQTRGRCPCCRQTEIPELISGDTPTGWSHVHALVSSNVELYMPNIEHMEYRVCIHPECAEIFEAGPRSCSETRDTFPQECDYCITMTSVHCPSCGLELEHAGGCLDFSCCVYGYDTCMRNRDTQGHCDHGHSYFTRFCGHIWRLEPGQESTADSYDD